MEENVTRDRALTRSEEEGQRTAPEDRAGQSDYGGEVEEQEEHDDMEQN